MNDRVELDVGPGPLVAALERRPPRAERRASGREREALGREMKRPAGRSVDVPAQIGGLDLRRLPERLRPGQGPLREGDRLSSRARGTVDIAGTVRAPLVERRLHRVDRTVDRDLEPVHGGPRGGEAREGHLGVGGARLQRRYAVERERELDEAHLTQADVDVIDRERHAARRRHRDAA